MFFYGSFASGRPRKFFRPQRLPRSADFGTLQKFAAQNRQTFEAAIPLLLLSGKMSATPIVCRCRSADFGTHQKYAAQSRQTFEAAITFPSRVRQDLCDANSLPVPSCKMFPPANSCTASCRQHFPVEKCLPVRIGELPGTKLFRCPRSANCW